MKAGTRSRWAWLPGLLGGLMMASPGSSADLDPVTFGRILAELNAKPDVPARLDVLQPIAASPACGLDRARMIYTVPRQVGRGPDGVSRFTVSETAQPILITRGNARDGVVIAAPRTMTVNVDGAPRAYHPDDTHGECRGGAGGPACALNLLCYAGVRVFENGREARCGARDSYKRAWQAIWPEVAAGRASQIPGALWRRDTTGRSEPRYGFVHPSRPLAVVFNRKVIPQAAGSGRPCRRDAAGTPNAGYFVSATSLTGDERENEPEGRNASAVVRDATCSPLPFVDAETIPAVVIPKDGYAGAQVGDAAVGFMSDGKGGGRLVYGIVGDEGPNHRFGEGSVAFNMALRGLDPTERAGRWAGDADVVRSAHLEVGDARLAIMILKNTASGATRDLSRDAVTSRTRSAFVAWGGGDEGKARARLASCLRDLARR